MGHFLYTTVGVPDATKLAGLHIETMENFRPSGRILHSDLMTRLARAVLAQSPFAC
jgi:hypothetical protein